MLVESGDGANISSLNQKALASVPVFFPSYLKQREIVDRIEIFRGKIDGLRAIYNRKLAALVELKQTILQKAFAGKLASTSTDTIGEAAE
jgi:type I restriction enzyme, S subunit